MNSASCAGRCAATAVRAKYHSTHVRWPLRQRSLCSFWMRLSARVPTGVCVINGLAVAPCEVAISADRSAGQLAQITQPARTRARRPEATVYRPSVPLRKLARLRRNVRKVPKYHDREPVPSEDSPTRSISLQKIDTIRSVAEKPLGTGRNETHRSTRRSAKSRAGCALFFVRRNSNRSPSRRVGPDAAPGRPLQYRQIRRKEGKPRVNSHE